MSQRQLLKKHVETQHPDLLDAFDALSRCSELSERVLIGVDSGGAESELVRRLEREELSCYAPIFCPGKYENAYRCLSKRQAQNDESGKSSFESCQSVLEELHQCHSDFGTRLVNANRRDAEGPCAKLFKQLSKLHQAPSKSAKDQEELKKMQLQTETCVAMHVCPGPYQKLISATTPLTKESDLVKDYERCMTFSEISFLATQGILHKE